MRTMLAMLGVVGLLTATAQATKKQVVEKTPVQTGWTRSQSGDVINMTRPLGRRSLLVTPAMAKRSALEAARWGISLTRWDVTITGGNTLELRAKQTPSLHRSGTPHHIRESEFNPIRVSVLRAAGQEQVTFVLPP